MAVALVRSSASAAFSIIDASASACAFAGS